MPASVDDAKTIQAVGLKQQHHGLGLEQKVRL